MAERTDSASIASTNSPPIALRGPDWRDMIESQRVGDYLPRPQAGGKGAHVGPTSGLMATSEVLTAESQRGREAIHEIMRRAYTADIDAVPAAWARALVVGGVPVSFILVDPDRQMAQPAGLLPYAFICDVATREDRRGEGHFRRIMEDTFSCLREANVPIVVTHGRHMLYRRFGFDVFTHHCGVFLTVAAVDRWLGLGSADDAEGLLTVVDSAAVQHDLLLVEDVEANTLQQSKKALRAAAALAKERGKARILFEHPRAPSYGSRYPIHPTLETPFIRLARYCGGRVCVQGADPEGGHIPDADWIKVLDAQAFVEEALRSVAVVSPPHAEICVDTDAGSVTIHCQRRRVSVRGWPREETPRITWPSSALAQLVLGYAGVDELGLSRGKPVPQDGAALLRALFPRRWRLSRNESWVLKH